MSPRPVIYDDALRDRLVQCAAAAIAESGYEAVSVRRVASMAGTSTSAIYTLFGSKEDLLSRVVTETIESFVGAQAGVPTTGNGVTDLKNLGRAYRDWAIANPDMYQLMFGARMLDPSQAPQSFSAVEPGIQPLIDAITRGIEVGDFATRSTPAEIATLMWTYVHGFVSLESAQWMSIPREDRNRMFELSLESQWGFWLTAQAPA